MPLTDLSIRQAKPGDKPRKLSDSRGLYIEIRPTGAKLWRYRYRIDGKENVFAIGEYPELSLADARIEHDKARALVKQGKHPARERSLARAEQILSDQQTFKSVSLEWLATKRHASESYQAQVLRAFTKNLFPYIGKMPIRDVTSAQLLECMRRMEARGAIYFAISLRNWISQMYRFAIRTLRADSDPAAALVGAFDREPVEHSRAMTLEEIADFRRRLAAYRGFRSNAIGLELLQLLFLRTVELRRGRWEDVDLDAALWDIPPEMMKKKRRHLVPLPPRAVELLRELHTITGGRELMFPGLKHAHQPVDGSTFNRALMYMGMRGWTCHDFRATASTHLYESGLFRSEVIEMQLAHKEPNQTKAAYNHAQYFDERKNMMAWWEKICLDQQI
ncbi:integrase arm-type DNA-binding domain-containing protein [Pseudomonas fulva]|uniref:tyrosine-type recombinase/integrase n=1 Tax=Pseudomonas fulva TaxID=47880 RepID=UPI00201DE1A7|nr:integrase arm-type DNA-binding domain-containing protein [Pseudomonas fulva]UQY33782.1 integrase arm-type DNA-binding domain-containing protein [Pseudomonas fulva]